MYEKAIVFRGKLRKMKTGEGILMQDLGRGTRMNGLHWNMEDGAVVDWHSHEAEQFGYVIKGGFKIWFENEEYEIHEGDCYFVPPIALGETEAIDLFNPIKEDIPKEI